ncbi:hypothetical protein EV361DRAFT_943916 [Lentinula raphanica]|uniref:Uncharacterized protein n=1 Tax=Lentinula raphanica TaxID=153919 RepID=A0AA38P3B2_9AGAR|nr:hypothetical protein C8R42DRAFT_671102 [Lentinula raphanica]KAJ3759029.1 hypothetical protein EV360DRAFT_82504 [Lentinula raphanica]KAJ3769756.1 hypothetical protein FB446DRAFT_847472 [Lentinula raphanica]KAJ3827115.1 hypothetical protein F5880DRAFT_1540174 [Lentinula raphanica]KAJ3835341.1 hypothetical protein F5878DRAFT_727589 [Lentinula raphanica]
MYPRPLSFLVLLSLGLFNLGLVTARLYPTRPVNGTVYHCGKCDPITWKDDGKKPSMQNLGLLTVDLYCKNQYVFTIGQADPDAEMLMFCPPAPQDFQWPQNCDAFILFFNGDNSNSETVYTHDFRISGTSRPARIDVKNHTLDGTSAFKTALGVSSQTFTTLPTPSVNQVPTSNNPPAYQHQQTYDTSGTTVYAEPLPSSNRPHRNGASFTRSLDMEKLKFRFVFIVWPALIGISMAL